MGGCVEGGGWGHVLWTVFAPQGRPATQLGSTQGHSHPACRPSLPPLLRLACSAGSTQLTCSYLPLARCSILPEREKLVAGVSLDAMRASFSRLRKSTSIKLISEGAV